MFLCIFAVNCCCLCALLDPGGSTLLLNFQRLLVIKVDKKIQKNKLIKKLIKKVDKKLIKKLITKVDKRKS